MAVAQNEGEVWIARVWLVAGSGGTGRVLCGARKCWITVLLCVVS